MTRRQPQVVGLLAVAVAVWAARIPAQHGTRSGEWRSYAGDIGATKYAPLDQITRENVSNLRIVWRRPAVDPGLTACDPSLRFSNNFRATPIMVNGVLYSPDGIGLAEAFDAATGRTIWVQEPRRPGSFAATAPGASPTGPTARTSASSSSAASISTR